MMVITINTIITIGSIVVIIIIIIIRIRIIPTRPHSSRVGSCDGTDGGGLEWWVMDAWVAASTMLARLLASFTCRQRVISRGLVREWCGRSNRHDEGAVCQ